MNIALHEFGGEIRCTEAGQPSVFDMIRVIGGKKDSRKTWKRLCEQHPEVVAKCHGFKFPGRGQQVTPVASDKEAAYYILGLLPGAAGKTYREQAANLFVRYLNADTSLAADIVSRSEDVEGVQTVARVAASQADYLDSHKGVHRELAARGCEGFHHATVNSYNNRLAGVKNGERPFMSEEQRLTLTALQCVEQVKLMRSSESVRGWDAVNTCKSAGNAMIRLLKQA